MLEDQWGKLSDVSRIDWIAFTGKLIQDSVDVQSVPQNDDVHDQGLARLVDPLALPDTAAEVLLSYRGRRREQVCDGLRLDSIASGSASV